MKFRMLSTVSLMLCVLAPVPGALAETLTINPFPLGKVEASQGQAPLSPMPGEGPAAQDMRVITQVEKSAVELMPEMSPMPVAAPEAPPVMAPPPEPKIRSVLNAAELGFQVPQPGDDYFSAPAPYQAAMPEALEPAAAMVTAPEVAPAEEAPAPQPEVITMVDKPEPAVSPQTSNQTQEPLRVRMSQSLADMGPAPAAAQVQAHSKSEPAPMGLTPAEMFDETAEILGKKPVKVEPAAPMAVEEPAVAALPKAERELEDAIAREAAAQQMAEMPQEPQEKPAPVPVLNTEPAAESIEWRAAPPPQQAAPQPMQMASAPQNMMSEMSPPSRAAAPAQAWPVWQVPPGANIRDVLQGWSERSNTRLVWDSETLFQALQPFELRGSYEGAVQTLLDQYAGQPVRPVATLYVDQQTKQKTLVIRVAQGS